MFFRNLQVYRLAGSPGSVEAFEKSLQRFVFHACSSLMRESHGWISPRGDERLVFTLAGHWLIALGTEQKLLPASVVKQEVEQRAADIEARTGFKPGRKRLREMRDEITDELLGRAFSRYTTTFAWIDPEGKWLVLDAASPKKANDLVDWLHKSVEEPGFELLRTERAPSSAMAEWLSERDGPPGFSIDRECVLQSPLEEKATVRYTHHPLLETNEIRNHIVAGKVPIRLALTWEGRISFALTEKLEVKRLAFLDIVRGEGEGDAESAEEQFESDFALMTTMLSKFLTDLVEALGGEAK